jgi:5'-methylthioadenosine phosphorylase
VGTLNVNEPLHLAVLGGSGFYEMPGLEDLHEATLDTPFGPTSDAIRIGTIYGRRVAFLARHGRSHSLLPAEIPQRANFWALKTLGVTRVLAVSAVGSLREDYAPGHVVIPDQLFDRTRTRASTFFGDGAVAHIGFADPFCPVLSHVLNLAGRQVGATVHRGGTYVCIEGPQFSTRAESRIYRQWGVDVIGMTALPEAKLAREAEIHYATLAFVTDYDVWHETEAEVSVELVVQNLQANIESGRRIIRAALPAIPVGERSCGCPSALESAVITRRDLIPEELRVRLAPLLSKYL